MDNQCSDPNQEIIADRQTNGPTNPQTDMKVTHPEKGDISSEISKISGCHQKIREKF